MNGESFKCDMMWRQWSGNVYMIKGVTATELLQAVCATRLLFTERVAIVAQGAPAAGISTLAAKHVWSKNCQMMPMQPQAA